jgi:DNA polymerase-3 subunit delta
MKLTPRDAIPYFAKPDPTKTGLLIFGADTMRVALRRQEVIAALIGPAGEEEMRLTRINGADLRKDPALLDDAVKAHGFFPGARVAFIDGATDGLAPLFKSVLENWAAGDAQVIATAGSLTAKSALRKAFEAHPNAYATGLYDDPPSRDEIQATLAKSGLTKIEDQAMAALTALAQDIDPGDFRQTVERISLYKLNDPDPLTTDEVALLAPLSTEAALDDVLNIVADARTNEIGPTLRKLQAQGVQPVGLCIGATRHFRTLFAIATAPGGATQGIQSVRPPIFGPRRDRMLRQAQTWGAAKLERALQHLTTTDLSLRSAQTAPTMALMERTLIRLAMMGKR